MFRNIYMYDTEIQDTHYEDLVFIPYVNHHLKGTVFMLILTPFCTPLGLIFRGTLGRPGEFVWWNNPKVKNPSSFNHRYRVYQQSLLGWSYVSTHFLYEVPIVLCFILFTVLYFWSVCGLLLVRTFPGFFVPTNWKTDGICM